MAVSPDNLLLTFSKLEFKLLVSPIRLADCPNKSPVTVPVTLRLPTTFVFPLK